MNALRVFLYEFLAIHYLCLFIFRTHGNFNSKEVGEELAQSLLTLFDPTLDAMLLDTETPQEQQLLIPIYTKPKTISAMLPGEATSTA